MMKKNLLSMAIMLAAIGASPLFAAPNDATHALPDPAQQPQASIAWLGVGAAPVPPALSAQLQQVAPPGQGVLIASVSPDSPAARAGIEPNDILLSYGDQKLYAPSQLAGLVRADHPGQKVRLKVVHHAQPRSVEVELGSRPLPPLPRGPMGRFTPRWGAPMMPLPPAGPAPGMQPKRGEQPTVWSSFESVNVKTLPDGRYHAEVTYKDANDESHSFTFEGKRDEIIDQIQSRKDLPQDKKQALLQALNFGGGLPGFPALPQNLFDFNDPMFRNFFRDMPPMMLPPEFRSFGPPPGPAQNRGFGKPDAVL